MCSGKSDALISRLLHLARSPNKARAFRPTQDTRDDYNAIISRTGALYPATRITHAKEALDLLEDGTTHVAFDEANLMADGFVDATLQLLASGLSVIVSALNLDWRGRPMAPMSELLVYASPDGIHLLTADCECGAPATRTLKLSSDTSLVEVGDLGTYKPACWPCFRAYHDGLCRIDP
jgi:thymidine kinase